MKVIIQDVVTKEYLGAKGRWVSAESEARDFLTLLRAYQFAKDNTARHFRILLFCPDDNYSAGIIEGIGTANARAAFGFGAGNPKEPWMAETEPDPNQGKWLWRARFIESRNRLN